MDERLKKLAVWTARTLLGATFIFSGFVKAIDPLGTQYKIQDYAAAVGAAEYLPDWATLLSSVLLSAFELSIGAFMLLAVARRLVSRLALLFMAAMTAVTLWIWIDDPVKDCGCFGDAVSLTNGETLSKNIILTILALAAARWPLSAGRLMSRAAQWTVVQAVPVGCVMLSLWCLYDLPLIDFRPYHVGADIKAGMEIPDNAEQPVIETTFVMEKDGVRKEFSLDNYPDSTWTFVDSRSVTVKEGYVPPIQDFAVIDNTGEDITDEILSDKDYVFLLVSPSLEHADDQNFGSIDQIYEYCQDHRYTFVCLTASGDEAIARWRELTGAEYPFCNTDATTLKTVIRSNPGLVVLKHGIVVGKWSHNRLPEPEDFDKILGGAAAKNK